MMIDLRCGDCLDVLLTLPHLSVHTCITSPPYWGLRDYGVEGQLGLEPTPDEYVDNLVHLFREVRRVLRDDGTVWLNLGDSYNSIGGTVGGGKNCEPRKRTMREWCGSLKPKDLVGIPWRVAFALQADGWWLRSDIIWHKPNCMPESVKDRPTKAHEYVFLLSKSARYYYDQDAVREASQDREWMKETSRKGRAEAMRHFTDGRTEATMDATGQYAYGHGAGFAPSPNGRNRRTVWTIPTRPFKVAHFATFPPDLIEPMVKAGCPEGGTVLDPFAGAGTVGVVAKELGRNAVLIELNPEYVEMAEKRIAQVQPALEGLA